MYAILKPKYKKFFPRTPSENYFAGKQCPKLQEYVKIIFRRSYTVLRKNIVKIFFPKTLLLRIFYIIKKITHNQKKHIKIAINDNCSNLFAPTVGSLITPGCPLFKQIPEWRFNFVHVHFACYIVYCI
jgi:hypothetical protein